MPMTPAEAANALRDIDQTEQHSSTLHGYEKASPFLILWGVMWALGYSGTFFFPPYTNLIWLVIAAVGTIGSMMLGKRAKPAGEQKFSWKFFFSWLAAIAAIASVLTIFFPFSGMQIGSLFPLMIGWAYVVLGIWMGARLAITGLFIVVLTLIGFFYLPAYFMLWMALVGGGGLLVGGLWLRSA
ncbi:MAG: hypothetical protein WBQ17_08285 [Rhizomicrobium sp.]